MKILMVGTGVIGAMYGKVLAEKYDVTHYVRAQKLQAMDNREIPFDLLDERQDRKHRFVTGTYTFHCTAKADDSYDLIIVPVKATQLVEALSTLVRQAPNTKYLLFTLDWQNGPAIDSLLRRDQYIMGYAGGGGTFKDSLLWANVGNDVMLGANYPEQKELLESTVALFKACGIMPEIPENPLHWLWMHNISAAPFGVAMGQYLNVGTLVRDRKMVKLSFQAMRECFLICKRRGVDMNQFPEFKMYQLPLGLVHLLFLLNFKMNPAMARFTAHAADSVDEMKANFMEIYQSGLEYAIDMPAMRKLRKMIAMGSPKDNAMPKEYAAAK